MHFFVSLSILLLASPGTKPILQQCGPYTFIETREKQQVRFENNGERVIYKEFKYYYFDQSRTNGSLDDVVIVPNIPEIVSVTQIHLNSGAKLETNLIRSCPSS